MTEPIEFHFDYISPYAYLAWRCVNELQRDLRWTIEPRAILFAGLLNAHGQKGPAEIEAKRRYVFTDIRRLASSLRYPLAPPASHPFNPLLALRVSGLEMPPETRMRLVDALFDATWAKGLDVTSKEVVGAIAARVGVDNAVERASTPEAKQRLRDATDAAIANGIFGVPTMLVGGHMFWGLDSVGHMERFAMLGDDVELDPAEWSGVAATATRGG